MTADQAIAIRFIADADAAWFIDHPDRNYRLRAASAAEVVMRRRANEMQPIPAGFKVFACIKQLEPHLRCTVLVLDEANNNADNASEAKAKALFELAVSRIATVH
jgi:hypothetical protein